MGVRLFCIFATVTMFSASLFSATADNLRPNSTLLHLVIPRESGKFLPETQAVRLAIITECWYFFTGENWIMTPSECETCTDKPTNPDDGVWIGDWLVLPCPECDTAGRRISPIVTQEVVFRIPERGIRYVRVSPRVNEVGKISTTAARERPVLIRADHVPDLTSHGGSYSVPIATPAFRR